MSREEPCRKCGRTLYFRANVKDALPYSICAVCHGPDCSRLAAENESMMRVEAAAKRWRITSTVEDFGDSDTNILRREVDALSALEQEK